MAAGKQSSGDAADTTSLSDIIERCDRCDSETPHSVSITIAPVSLESRNPKYAREPCRTKQCHQCGELTTQVMNH